VRDKEELRVSASAAVQESKKESKQECQQLIHSSLAALRGELDALEARLGRALAQDVGGVRAQLREEASQLDLKVSGVQRELREACDGLAAQARAEAEELKEALLPALEAQGQVTEALASKQRLLEGRLEEGLTREGTRRDELTQRACDIECDLGKVKAHLPILFAPARAFR